MLNLLIVCPLSLNGHTRVNKFIVETFAKKYNVIYVARENHTSIIEDCVETIVIPEKFYVKKNGVYNRLKYYQILKFLSGKLANCENVLFLTYETISFSFYTWFKSKTFINKTFYVLISHQIDEINTSKIKKWFWGKINKYIIHIVKEECMKDNILKNFPSKKVVCIKRSKNKIDDNYISKEVQEKLVGKYNIDINKTVVISPSKSSSDIEHINEMIEKIDAENVFFIILAKREQKVLAKKNVLVINEYIGFSQYYNLIKLSNIVWLPYKKTYNLRSSTILLECVELEKKILARKTEVFSNYFDNYNIGEIYGSRSEGCQKLYKMVNQDYEFKKIKKDFSDQEVMEDMLTKITFISRKEGN